MKDLSILLVCGSGASSGFMATNINKAAKKRGLNCKVLARSKSEVDSYIDSIDMVMIGPHMKHIKPEVDEKAKERDVKVVIMKKSYYALLDGDAALDHILTYY
ncbi:PTS sugar transporter subunit IIB [Robertmurraya siralis]|uniref:PTS sugar transporter subunit IIB n=1 Tax=Robertmurraya siralis TaxID=77777 RepID=A0A919WM44_9BACI|nr:PTS sugar transporter subunit IIB [Robertmurraya siralis]PAE19761.1 PTS sugar transporter subunit IIB [Bacillus sp. 7504-2]GIN64124.1 PTS sugar transporter subunit IIB [Robertmurraya siralis]